MVQMSFPDRRYYVYLTLGDPSSEPLWEWTGWTQFYEAFDPVVKLCRDKPSLRVSSWIRGEKSKERKR